MVGYKKYFFRVLFIVLILNFSFSYGQIEIDTLKGKTYKELLIIISKKETLNEKNNYSDYFIKRAKKEKDNKSISLGYYVKALLLDDEIMLKYCDSIIDLTLSNGDYTYLVGAYQLKGDFFYKKKDYKRALNNYIKVSFFARKYKNESQIFSSNYNIGILKRKIGDKEEALKLYQENYFYAKRHIDKISTNDYLTSITAISNIFNDMNLPDSSSYYNRIGIRESKRLNENDYFNHFSLNEGVSYYYKKEYLQAIDYLEKYIPYYERKKTMENLSLAYYYCGKAYLEIKKENKAISYFKKLDTVFQKTQKIYHISRNGYEHLISYYKKKEDLNNQLIYINQLIKVDSILHSDDIYINRKIFKEYDIPKLAAEKKVILKKMQEKNYLHRTSMFFGSIIILTLIFFVILQNRKRKLYKKRFEDVLIENKIIPKVYQSSKSKINIPEDIEKHILTELVLFEETKEFVSNQITLNSLAKKLKTNSSYLSKVVNYHKNDSFSAYLSSLRIEYIIDKLKTNTNIRKFTIKAIAEEAGFNNSESFSKSFYKIKGIKPSYFMKELNNLK
jgi:AraC-like DNA-binding protein